MLNASYLSRSMKSNKQ